MPFKPLCAALSLIVTVSLASAPVAWAAEPLPLPAAPVEPAIPNESRDRSTHLLQAARHLEAAGLPEQAAHFKKEAERAMLQERQLRKQLERKLAELERIRGEVHELREQIGAPQRISLKVTILELDLSHPKLADVRAQMRGPDASDVADQGNAILLTATPTPRHSAGQLASMDQDAARRLARTIALLKSAGALRVVAEPELVTTDGRPAHLMSGGEFAVPVPQPDGSCTMEWREFGVRMEVVAHTIGNDRVRLELDASIAERDYSQCLRVGGMLPGINVALVPGLNVTRVHTKNELRLGEPAVLGGLITSRTSAQNRTGDSRKVERVIIVRPEACEPILAEPAGQ